MASPTAADFVRQAEQEIGVPYVYGGDSPSGFDCSGLVFWCLHQIGIASCPRTSEEQWAWCEHLGDENDLLAGDLIFEEWPGDTDTRPGRVVIFVSDGHLLERALNPAHGWSEWMNLQGSLTTLEPPSPQFLQRAAYPHGVSPDRASTRPS